MPADCCKKMFARTPEDEPVFLIRGKDKLALATIQKWYALAESAGVNEDKLSKVREHITAIQQFQIEHNDRCKIPD